MTLNTQHTSDTYLGNGITTVFPITFQFYSGNEIVVQFDDGVNPPVNQSPSSYGVSGGDGSTGSVIFIAAPPAQNVIINRVLPLVQQASYTRNDPFPSATHEIALDRIVMMIQQTLAGAGVGASVTPEFIQDIVGTMFTDGAYTNITFAYDDPTGVMNVTATNPGIADAPSDSKYYVRRNAGWIEETWANIINKPATFPPDAHTHVSSAITDLTAVTQAVVAPMFNHSDHTNVVFTYDSLTKLFHATVLKGTSSNYRWSDVITLVDPTSGFIATNNALMNLVTRVVVANIDFDGFSSSLATAAVGDTIIISNLSRTTPGKYLITVVTPQTGYVDYTVTADTGFSSGDPQTNDSLVVSLIANVSGISEAPVDGVARTRKNAAWTALTWADIASVPGTFPPSAHTHPISDLTNLIQGEPQYVLRSVAGTAQVITASSGKSLAQIAQYSTFLVNFALNNTGADPTLSVDGIAGIPVKGPAGAAIAADDLDSTVWQKLMAWGGTPATEYRIVQGF